MRLLSFAKAFTLLFAVAFIVSTSFGQTTFPGTGVGSIPDATACGPTPGTPLNITFNVTGVSGNATNLSVSTTFGTPNHTWMGDVVATLIAPNATTFTIFGVTTSTTATGIGDSSDLGGTYTFGNAGTLNWWDAATLATAAAIIPPGSYRTARLGGAGATNAVTDLNAAFAAAPANGTWTLRVTDGCTGDTGAITAASLTIGSTPVNAPHDINGDGKSDFVVVRPDASSSLAAMGVNDETGKDKVANAEKRGADAPQAGTGWWSVLNNNSSPARVTLGQDTDFFVMEDFDADGKDDFCVYSPGAAGVAAFRILKSSTNTVSTRIYGQAGDDPTVVGDWNGDGKADLAVYRDGTTGSPQSFFFWSDETTPTTVNYIPWGTDGDVAYMLDYDGDGKLDPGVQRNGGGGRGDHYIQQSSNGASVYIIYGLSSDFVLPGDYDGDGRDDLMVSRNANFGAGTFKYFWLRESDGGVTNQPTFQWGISGDFICQGDYDGDGKTDVAIWRSNVDPTMNFFYARRSSDGGLQQLEWGASGDYPVNNWNVH